VIDLSNKKLDLSYPCKWCYKLIVEEEHHAKNATKDIIQDREHTLAMSKTSKKGKYKSYSLELIVDDEEDRQMIYEMLKKHHNIKMVV